MARRACGKCNLAIAPNRYIRLRGDIPEMKPLRRSVDRLQPVSHRGSVVRRQKQRSTVRCPRLPGDIAIERITGVCAFASCQRCDPGFFIVTLPAVARITVGDLHAVGREDRIGLIVRRARNAV